MQKIFNTLRIIAKEIHTLLQDSSTSYLQSTNSTGDTQLAVDVAADLLIESKLLELENVLGICSEEKSTPIKKNSGQYLIAYDPLDGSSLMDSNLSVGSIFGIYERDFQAQNLVASAYIVYGPRTEIIFADQTKTTYQKLKSNQQWQDLPAPNLKHQGKINATGGTQKFWSNQHKIFIQSFFDEGYRLRYSGGMVPDLHQILIKGGGIFSYPTTSDAPNGKLRMLFEVFPFAFIYEKCGGMAIDGKNRLLDLHCSHIHQTTPCFFGSQYEIQKLLKLDEGAK